jgi:C4-dicarboxylate-specific signal transduction histidine kinase
MTLALGDEILLSEGPEAARRVVFDQQLSSRTQLLRLTLSAEPSPPLPWSLLLAVALALLALAWALDRLLNARRAAREAGLRALVARHDAKLAHASRVNAMGELASGIAHELTQPLTAILSHAQAGQRLAARPEFDRAAIATAFDAVTRNAKRAGDILGRLRSWLTKGQPKIEQVDLAAVVTDVSQLVAIDAAADGIALSIELEPGAVHVMADRVHLEQVLFNLVRNAMEALAASEGRREIRIGWELALETVAVTVRDNGPGFTANDLALVFEPFFTTRADGMGLGLALCTTLVERYGGSLTAENATDGGALMTMRLPMLPRERKQRVALEAE